MLNLRLTEIALWTRGSLHGADVPVRGVCTDTRKLGGGELFVALKGERLDGHDFVASAAAHGAAAALVSRRVEAPIPQVLVTDTLLALGDLASAVRAQRRARVVGITGSNGKTTVKTLTASILARHGRTHVNAGNFNNEIGLPLTLLEMPENAEYAVLEMGAGKPGDIAYLAAIARPEIGLVNNIAPAHLERMGSLEGVAETKGALYQALPADGVAVINADDAFAGFFAGLAGTRRVLRFGLDHSTDVGAEIRALGAASDFVLNTPQGAIEVMLPLAGRHNVMNALAASAIACALDVPLATIREGLEQAPTVAGRLLRHTTRAGWTLIDDSYNANPGSTAAAIATLALEAGLPWLVLGDMAELGPEAERLHAEIGTLARRSGIARLYTVGRLSRTAAAAFGAGAEHFADQSALIAALRAALKPGVVCLVKGSRSSAMDRVVAALLGHDGGGERHAA
ncbi:UDP-N-acetylmuramoyl-tripeptide--D-alanyl-D-alanine ligase [Mizugakiibacter sediminis]|uniref:UDP-N-acetylmuramoyl-tripeptide--D-alanyl-D-alanine ligase n=1 Tax=Mizugakiibacter sediminis TaxID=1475481 RepID=A0A0K8QQH5_9GAMM|nr:UDP-N-acetylmuramoyl-tripeptide--D-alanyl-D-alanine ligase [Mizugakiibacter sediminis]GAP67165.1 UDP-N-acetylmuramoyl-tripeptide--D-alanyl-D-alanine ligase [Mizugakiibacter sediminis]